MDEEISECVCGGGRGRGPDGGGKLFLMIANVYKI